VRVEPTWQPSAHINHKYLQKIASSLNSLVYA
jgi:hypothetical protein